MKPVLLDCFCCAGGATKGYQNAGFYVVGVDIEKQPHYIGDEFYQDDALDYIAQHGKEYDAIHASPPCQGYSVMTNGRWQDRIKDHPKMITEVRNLLLATGKPYIIENVSGARSFLINPILLCGTMFGLQTKQGNQLFRHRYFECSFGFWLVPSCQHNNGSAIGVYGGRQNPARKKAGVIGVYGHTGGSSSRAGTAQFDVNARREAMGIDWMTNEELSEAIPPVYTQFFGTRLMEYLKEQTHE
jgi:DNA (cytosine-5)-methyltransferase 1